MRSKLLNSGVVTCRDSKGSRVPSISLVAAGLGGGRFGRIREGSFCRGSPMIAFSFPPPTRSHILTIPSTISAHHVDNGSTSAITPAYTAHNALTPTLPSHPVTPTLPPRQQQLQASTQRPPTRETHTLQSPVPSCTSASPEQTTCLPSPLECKGTRPTEEEAVPAHDATRGHLLPLVPHESQHSRLDHHGKSDLITHCVIEQKLTELSSPSSYPWPFSPG